MGSTGVGNTTRLDVIAGRKTGGTIKGKIMLNGYEANDLPIRRCTGYCEQMDVQSEASTFREAFRFSARPADMHDIADQIIHSSLVEQMTRLMIGVEFAAQPRVIFLDQPTSGLDARSDKLMDGVRKVADSGRTIVCTIQQSSTEVFYLFGNRLLLKSGGETMIVGEVGNKCRKQVEYLASIPGVAPLQKGYNPATWILEVIGAGVSHAAGSTDFVVAGASSGAGGRDDPVARLPEMVFTTMRAASSWTLAQFLVVRFRDMYWRTPSYNLTRFVVTFLLALVFGMLFLNGEYKTYQGINGGVGMVFMTTLVNGIVSFNSVLPISCEERESFYRELMAHEIGNPLLLQTYMGQFLAYALPSVEVASIIGELDLLLVHGFQLACQRDSERLQMAQHGVALGFIVKEQRETAARTSVSPSATPRVESLKLHVSSYVGRKIEPLLHWLVEVDTAITARRIVDPLSKVAFAMSCLGGRARSWAYGRRLTDPTCFSTYEDFKDELKLAFEPPQNEFRSRAEFLDLQQGKHDVHAYAQRARYLVSNIVTNPIDEATKVVTFMNGLRDGPVKTYLFREYPNTLEAAIALTMQEEFSLRQAKLHVNAPRLMPRPVVRPSGGPEPMDLSSATAAGNQQRRGSTNHLCTRRGAVVAILGIVTGYQKTRGTSRRGDAVERVDIGHAAMKIAAPSESRSHCKKQDDKPNLVILKKEFVDELIVQFQDDKFDMVLGMPWLARHDPVIDWTKRTIVRFGNSSSATESDGPVGAAHAPRAGLHDEAVRDQAGLERARPRVKPAGEYKEQLSTAGPGQEETRGAGLRTRSERRKREKLRKSRSGTETLQAVSAGQTQELETTVETLSVLTRTSIGLQYKKMRLDNPPTLASELMSLPVTSWKRFARDLHDGRIEQICILSDVERMTCEAEELNQLISEGADAFSAKSKKERFDEQGWYSLKASPFYKVLREYKDDKGVQHEIDLVPGTKYCVTRQWPLPREQVKAIDDFFESRRKAGQVRESKSPHSTPTFCVKKPQGGWRIVHAYNKLNDATVPAQTPIPRKDVIIDSMTSSTIFSTLDLRDGFYQILMRESDIPLTAVSTPSGMLWEWLVMPQGLKNAPATFNRPFVVYTDHASLRTAIKSPHMSQRMARWLSFFAEYNFQVEYKPGRLNVVADALSRRPDYAVQEADVNAVGVVRTTTPSSSLLDDVKAAYAHDADAKQLLEYFSTPSDKSRQKLAKHLRARVHRYRVHNGLLLYSAVDDNTDRIVVPDDHELKLKITYEYHDAPTSGHPGREKTYLLLTRDFYWSHQYKWVRKYVRACELSMSTADHLQTDGQTERVNRVLVDTMKSYAHSFHQWSDCLPMAEFAINSSLLP
uniref:Reverse transcriptase domain-containing protein n=1 Tax=Phytophthora ramorum TaxID=164328 RepID=H3GFF6_PHYRM